MCPRMHRCPRAHRNKIKTGKFPLWLIILLTICAVAGGKAAASPFPTLLTSADQVLHLSAEELNQRLPAKINGVVTYVDPALSFAFLQDGTRGVAFLLNHEHRPPVAGDRIELNGTANKGMFAPYIASASIIPLGKGEFPEPRKVSLDQAQTGQFDGLWVEVEGTVRSASVQEARTVDSFAMEIANGTSRLRVNSSDRFSTSPDDLVEAAVRVRGVLGGTFNGKNQFMGARLLVPETRLITVVQRSGEQSFARPVSKIDSLVRFSPESEASKQVHIRGVVTWAQRGFGLYLQDDTGAIHVRTTQTTAVHAGENVDAVGFINRTGSSPSLEDGAFARTESRETVVPKTVVLNSETAAIHDGELIITEAKLLGIRLEGQEAILTLESGDLIFPARLRTPDHASQLRPGSLLQITGVSAVRANRQEFQVGLDLLVRDRDDIKILSTPAWWTTNRLVGALALLSILIPATLIWIYQLKRRVDSQTKALRNQIEQQAALESRHRDLVENANDIIFTHDLEGRFTSINKAGEQTVGYSRQEILKLNIWDLIAPDCRNKARSEVKKSIDGHGFAQYETDLIGRGGERLTVEIDSRCIRDNGSPAAIQGIARDVTGRKRAEERIKSQDHFIRSVIDLDPNLIFVKDDEGRYVLANRATGEFCGVEPDKMVGKSDADIFSDPELIARIKRDDREVIITSLDKFTPEEKITNNRGQSIWLQTVRRPLSGEHGQSRHILVVSTDITAHKHTEDALRESQTLYTSLVQCLPVAVFRKDLDGRFTFGNAPFCKLLGKPIQEIISKTDADFSPPELAVKYQSDNQKIIADGETFEAIEEHLTRTDGTKTYIQIVKAPIFNSRREVTGVQGIIWDVTNLKAEEEELKRTRTFLKQVVENLPIAVFIKEAQELRFIMWNKAGEDLVGYSSEEMLGKNDYDFFSKGEADRFTAADRQALSTSRLVDVTEEVLQTRHRGQRLLRTRKIPILDETGKPLYLLGISEDVTEARQSEVELKRAKEAAEAAARAKGEFLANVSHEIRTPMNGVIGMTNLLLDTELSEEQLDFVNTVKWSADGLLTIINDILDFSKMEAGKLHFETLDFDLRETVETTAELLSERASHKKIELAAFIPNGLPGKLRGDPGRLRQVLLNLLGNAVKFTERGEVVLHVSMESETASHTTFRFEVTDTGIGISPTAQKELFQPFTQADGSTTRKFGGTGLGLAICKQLVTLMGGEIGLRSELGKGSTFWFTTILEKQAEQSSQQPFDVSLENVRLLIVDDNAINRRILHHHAVSWRMENSCAASASEAMDMLSSAANLGRPYDVVILDMQMPEVDGMMLARRIRSHSQLHETRMLMLTSLGHQHKREVLAEAGISGCLLKPVRQSDLYNRLLEIVGAQSVLKTLEPLEATIPTYCPGTASPVLAPARQSRPGRILLAEDNPVNQKVALRQLQKLGYTADTASNGLEVLAAVEKITYDVILMDCQMPEMDGYEATQHLRQQKRTAKTHIIAMTANAMQGDRDKCLSAGMDDYISKPVTIDDLQSALNRVSKEQPESIPVTKGLPVLNQTTLDQLRDLVEPGEPNPLIELIDLFLTDAPDCLAQLKEAMARHDDAESKRFAHSLKGSSNNLGAQRLGLASHNLEAAARSGDLTNSTTLVEQIESELELARAALLQERANCALAA